ncbi:hypothetical protein Bca52824_028016 [Brassica carinata]|uniref:Gnk2-homologous domain-containing protein n=1 Tax=Brassica carinata TaxID=52824 RepID=A0A8X7VBG8_BRACI|nr:hypothetical protein Bca52824_028016 [Brassica carinata]
MGKEDTVLILCFFIISYSAIYVSAQTCDDTGGNFKPSSPYDKNRRLINSTLLSDVTNHNGWFNGSIGLGPNIVYDMGMCSPGAGPDACSSCINDAFDSLLQSCWNQSDAFSWLGEDIICLVRYSSKPFGVLSLKPFSRFYNSFYVSEKDKKGFDSVWDGLMTRMITSASSSVWRLWENESLLELVDNGIKGDCKRDEVIRYIHIGMLCVQENPVDRPTLSTIHQMLTNSSVTLPVPRPPGFFFGNGPRSNPLAQGLEPGQSSSKSIPCSVDEATITDVTPR